MCFNKEVSFLSFIIALAVVVKLYIEKNNFLATIVLLITTIQLIEFFIWTFFKSPKLNYYFTFLVCVVLVLQIVISYIMSETELTPEEKEKHKTVRGVMFVCVVVFFITSVLFIYNVYRTHGMSQLTSIVSKHSCRLLWGFQRNKNPLYNSIFGYISAFLYPILLSYVLYITENYDIMFVILGSLAMVLMYNFWYGIPFSQNYGSIWCFLSNLLIIYVIIIRFEDVNPSLINIDHGLSP